MVKRVNKLGFLNGCHFVKLPPDQENAQTEKKQVFKNFEKFLSHKSHKLRYKEMLSNNILSINLMSLINTAINATNELLAFHFSMGSRLITSAIST